MSAEQKRLYNNKIKLIRSECQKKWPGNTKVYFKNNNTNTLILSEMVMLLEPVAKIEEIGFGKSAIRNHILKWASEKNRRIEDGYDFEETSPPAKRARKEDPIKLNQEDVATDVEKSSTQDFSSDVTKMSAYSAQLIVTVAFKRVTFRSLSYKDMVKAAKVLGVKSRAIGKYGLGIQLVEQQYVEITEGRNFISLGRDDIKFKQNIQLDFSTKSSSVVESAIDESPSASPTTSCPSAESVNDSDRDSDELFNFKKNQLRDVSKLKKIILAQDESQDVAESRDIDLDETQDIDSD